MSNLQLIPAMMSLVDKTGQPLKQHIANYLAMLHQSGVDGVLVMGTTGEFPHFSVSQRQQYLETVQQHNPGLQVMVNVGASNLQDTLVLQQHALTHQTNSVLWMPPFYFPANQINSLEVMLNHLLNAQPSDVPFYAYHYPKNSQVPIPPDWLNRFPKLAGIKDTSGDMAHVAQYVQTNPSKAIFVGTDYAVTQTQAVGACGIVSGLLAVLPQHFVAARHGDTQAEEQLKQVRTILDGFCKIPALKALLAEQMGWDTLPMLPPFQPLSPAERESLLREVLPVLKAHAVCR